MQFLTVRLGGKVGISLEQAFDAILDDDEFMALLGGYAKSVGAKGFAAGWTSQSTSVENIFAVDNEWTADLIQEYYTNYSDRDPWTTSIMQANAFGKFVDVADYCKNSTWENSELYNDLLRPAGDDTYRALATMVPIPGGFGGVTFYRNRTQREFSDRDLALLQREAGDIGRLVALKAALKRATLNADTWRSLVDRFAAEAIVVDAHCNLIDTNEKAENMIRDRRGLFLSRGRLFASSPDSQRLLEKAVHLAMTGSAKDIGIINIASSGERSSKFYVLRAHDIGAASRVLLLGEMPADLEGTEPVLRMAYGLSPAEASLMSKLASGKSASEVADNRGVSIDTIRTQYRSAMSKMGCAKLVDAIVAVRRLIVLDQKIG